jgi:hypothetical protein
MMYQIADGTGSNRVHYDEHGPRAQRYRVVEIDEHGLGIAHLAAFPTEREAQAFSRGFWRGAHYYQRTETT